MKYFKNLFAACLIISVLWNCSSTKKEYVLKVKLQKLSTADIYNKYLVSDVIFDAKELNTDSLQTESRKLFLQGIDQFKNKKNQTEAVKLFIASILIFPEAKTYYELGNALANSTDSTSLSNAINAYEVAAYLNFQPSSTIYLQKACVYNTWRDNGKPNMDWLVTSNLRMAFNDGFLDTLALRKNPKINSIMSDPEYSKIVTYALSRQQNTGENGLFTLFKKSFPATSGVFEISSDDVSIPEHKESISYDFAQFIPEMENTSFGREVSHDYFYVAKIAETQQYVALVYASVNFFGDQMQPVNTTLVTYDSKGNSISRRLISCQCSSEKIKTCKIENNIVLVEEYTRVWESPIDKVSFDLNKVISSSLVSTAKYRISDSGEIMDEDVPANFKDTVLVTK